jgi:GR25 family glycosyltransferase involved in LPS biosynthesis
MAMNKFSAFVINLDDRSDRWQEFLKNKEEMGYGEIHFERISAVKDENFGGLGCAKSHIAALVQYYSRSNAKYCMILEDDFRFKENINYFTSFFNDVLKLDREFKVVLLAGTNVIKFGNSSIAEIFESQTTAGYIVSREYVHELINNYLRAVRLMERHRGNRSRNIIYSRFSIDQTWKCLQHEGQWYSSVPMIGHQISSYSNIENKIVDYSGISA